MWPFKKNECVRDGKFVGRKYKYDHRFRFNFKKNVTPYEIGLILQAHFEGGASEDFVKKLPKKARRHFSRMLPEEYDRVWNPDMEHDQAK